VHRAVVAAMRETRTARRPDNRQESVMLHFDIDMATVMPVEATAHPDVLFDLGLMYASGRSGVVDLIAAHKWFNLAALKGRTDAVPMRREIAELMTEAEIAQAQRDARAWMQTQH